MNKQTLFIDSIEYNNFEYFEKLLNDPKFDPSQDSNYAAEKAAIYNRLDMLKLLVNDKRVDPSDGHNQGIIWAWEQGHYEIVDFLFQDVRVKKSLKNNHIKLYNIINKKFVDKKIKEF